MKTDSNKQAEELYEKLLRRDFLYGDNVVNKQFVIAELTKALDDAKSQEIYLTQTSA